MVFMPGSWLPALPSIPDVPLHEFLLDEKYGRASLDTSLDAYVCATSGKVITAKEQKQHVEVLAQAISFEMGWATNEGSEYDKVVGIFAQNTIDIPTLHWAVHRLNGVCAPINATYTAVEVAALLIKSKAKALFTVLPVLEIAKKAAALSGIPLKNVYVCDMAGDDAVPTDVTTISQLLIRGKDLPNIEQVKWSSGQSERQCAYLSHSSGTSGPPKLAAVSHRNIIANVIQVTLFELEGRGGLSARQIVLGLLPASHVYGIVLISAVSTYRGDQVIVLPRFDVEFMLKSVERYRINVLSIVPPIIIQLSKNPELLSRYDLASVRIVLSGGAPIDEGSLNRLNRNYPRWLFRQGYGLTEIGATISLTPYEDPWAGSAGCIIPGVKVKLLRGNGTEVNNFDEAGEVYAQGPGVILGYPEDAMATKETFVNESDGRWLRTGDIAIFKRSILGNEHIFIVDRVKEVIKVKGLQVVPAELEACLLNHPSVLECAVIGVAHELFGEVPKAFVQKSMHSQDTMTEEKLALELQQLVQSQKARHKWLLGGVKFVDTVPKSPSGKILRRLLRDGERYTEHSSTSKL